MKQMGNKNSKGLAILLIALGALILLGKLTPFLGSLFGLLIAVAMVGLGYYGIKRGNAFFGWVILIIGLIALISKLAWLIVPVLGIGLIIYGISTLKGKRSY